MRKIFYLYILCWITVVCLSFGWHFYRLKQGTNEIAYQDSKTFFDLVVLTREWNALHGGVYAKVSDFTPPNPFLKDPLRDIKINKNFILTKINPAYMTRQLSKLSEKEKGVKINITSLKPLNPNNVPNHLEKEAFLSFKKGKKEFFKKISGNRYFYMSVLNTEKECLKCHKNQGYKVGDIMGGISIVIPFESHLPVGSLALGHFFIGFIGICFIIYSGKKLTEAYEEIKNQAIYDGLTNIYNRREFERRFSEELNRAKREGSMLSIIICDIDWFKKYNDSYGHQIGDKCITKVAATIKASLKRATDFCARYGGEEFIIVLPNTDREGCFKLAEEIRINIKKLGLEHKESPFGSVTLSFGIATIKDVHNKDITEEFIIKKADNALYQAKKEGRDKVVMENNIA